MVQIKLNFLRLHKRLKTFCFLKIILTALDTFNNRPELLKYYIFNSHVSTAPGPTIIILINGKSSTKATTNWNEFR